jgi:hypothetical protein
VITSLRFTDAVYSIDHPTGEVEWKLGGTTIPESLTVLGDPHGNYPLSGQHDAPGARGRTVTVHDNAPRAVRCSWGGRAQATEFAADGSRAFRLTFAPLTTAPFSYRAFPVPTGLLEIEALRAG